MSVFFKNHKKKLAALIILLLTACILGGGYVLYHGRESSVTPQSESLTVFAHIEADAAIENLGIEGLSLPPKYTSVVTDSAKVSRGKRYTMVSVAQGDTEIRVTRYAYAYIMEDLPLNIPGDALALSLEGREAYVFPSGDRACLAYSVGRVEYLISDSCSLSEMAEAAKTISFDGGQNE